MASSQRLYRLAQAGAAALNREQERGASQHRRAKMRAWLLRLYPRAWRERYGGEMQALLEHYPMTLLTIVDLLLGALDARLDPHYRTPQPPPSLHRLQRLWVAHSTTLFTFATFITCYLTLVMAHGDYFWQELGNINPLVAQAYIFIIGGVIAGLCAVAAIQLLMAFSLITQKIPLWRKLLHLLPTVTFFTIAGLMIFGPDDQGPPLTGIIGVGVMLVCLAANAYVTARNRPGKWVSRIALLPTACVNLGMASTAVGALACQILVNLLASLGGSEAAHWPIELLIGFPILLLILFFSTRAFVRALADLVSPSKGTVKEAEPLEQQISG